MSTTTLAPENQASITVCRSETKQRSAPLTWREFAQLATREETSQQELWHGEVIDMPRPGYAHGKVLLRLSQLLANYLDARPVGHAVSEVGLIVSEDTVLGPDLAFWTNERYPPNQIVPGLVRVIPDLIVEILSPYDSASHMMKKIVTYLTTGVRLVWIADPETRSITVWRPNLQGAILRTDDTLQGEDVLPGFGSPVSRIFA
ncbi:MAG: Uma2 family endonuclease [Gemmatales bacterium]|nr:Uma2 family endonuclease [Gemmatales bacterium]